MPKSQKPVVFICGSRNILDLCLDNYLDKDKIGCVVSGGANGVDTIAEKWAKSNNIEFVAFLPDWNTYGKRAGLKRNEDMVKFSDFTVAFWDGKSKGTKYSIKYSEKLGHKTTVHIIKDAD